ncbi:hypothetical protein C487_13949 [Natrinema pallidum DSM 3751]|uniref:Uncharacterized protein n=1 Tax=Natrinema pallidum DSM 3751 TaxID=1227495 RepID=L9YMP6_9EURY|nr:hypothetical protein C487_13949 [Natrinema pallidum DSM 3751]
MIPAIFVNTFIATSVSDSLLRDHIPCRLLLIWEIMINILENIINPILTYRLGDLQHFRDMIMRELVRQALYVITCSDFLQIIEYSVNSVRRHVKHRCKMISNLIYTHLHWIFISHRLFSPNPADGNCKDLFLHLFSQYEFLFRILR